VLHLLAIISFVFGVVFYAWSLGHGVWTWPFFELLGLTLWCASSHEKSRW